MPSTGIIIGITVAVIVRRYSRCNVSSRAGMSAASKGRFSFTATGHQ